jgi:hypothetical protein
VRGGEYLSLTLLFLLVTVEGVGEGGGEGGLAFRDEFWGDLFELVFFLDMHGLRVVGSQFLLSLSRVMLCRILLSSLIGLSRGFHIGGLFPPVLIVICYLILIDFVLIVAFGIFGARHGVTA